MASTALTTPAASADPRGVFIRRAGALAAGTTAGALQLWLAWQSGGYFPESYLLAGAVAFAVLAVILLALPPRHQFSDPAVLALAALLGLALWTGASARWSSQPDTALEDFGRVLAYVGIFALGLVASGSGRTSRHVVYGALLVSATVVCAGLASRFYPEIVTPPPPDPFTQSRLAYPLSYWNTFGTLGSLTVVLGAGLAADLRTPVVVRSLAAALTVPAGTAAYLSFSRGAWLAFFAGVIVLLALAPRRLSLLATLGICCGGLSLSIARVASEPALLDEFAPLADRVSAGRACGLATAGLAIGVALAQAVLSGRWMPADAREALARYARPIWIGISVLAVLAAGLVYVLHFAAVEGRTAAALRDAETWVDRQWDEFMQPAGLANLSGSERLTSARGTRSDLYRVAIDGFERRPLIGDGAGGFEVRFAYDRRVDEKVRDAHSLYLEVLGELGLVGAVLLIAFLGALIWAAVRARQRCDVLTGGQAAAVIAAVTVWLAHAMVDWDWQIPAFTGIGLILAGTLFSQGPRRRRRRRLRHRHQL